MKILKSVRVVYQDVETFEKQTVYISHIDLGKFRVKIFEHGKLILKKDINGTDDIAFIEKRLSLFLKKHKILC